MAQINYLLNVARSFAGSAGSATGVTVANANLVAVAGALSGMQLSGYQVVSTDLISSIAPKVDDLDSILSQKVSPNESLSQQTQVQNTSNIAFAHLVDPGALLGTQDFFNEQPTQVISNLHSAESNELMLEHSFMFDPNQLEETSNFSDKSHSQPALSNASEDHNHLQQNQNVDLALTPQNLDVKSTQTSISQAATTSASSINYASSLEGGQNSYSINNSDSVNSGLLLEIQGFVYHSTGTGDIVHGSIGADTLFGSSLGGDTLIGGSGSDIYAIYSNTTVISESPNGGINDTAYVGVDNYEGTGSVEKIIALNNQSYQDHSANSGPYLAGLDSGWHINGSIDMQTLIGGAGADILNGRGGADTLIGGAGDDVYFYSGQEIILESKDSGNDIIQATANLTLPDNIEVGIAINTASDVNITGNSIDNLLIGNTSSNSLMGGLGADTLVGNGGDDVFMGGLGSDTFILNGAENYLGSINDFHAGEDHISIAVTDPTITLSLAPGEGFTGIAGQVLITDGGLQFDWNGDSEVDSLLLVNEAPTISDLTLIDHNHVPHF